jgi:hypothetical protein
MADEPKPKRFAVDHRNLPTLYPTHKHTAEFWEALGRTVATSGFLEEVLGKAVFSFTATRRIPEDKAEEEFAKWLPTLEKALSDPLGGLIDTYGKAVRDNSSATITNLDDLLRDLREASVVRNVLCHGSWRVPDHRRRSIPLFVDRKKGVFQSPIDIAFLQQVQRHAVELACAVINTVTHMGWQFPGSHGPGSPILRPLGENAREG